MEKSPSIVNLAKALKAFHATIGKITKDSKNPYFNSKYADLSTILDAIKQPLLDANLSFTQFPEGTNTLVTTLMHTETGEYMSAAYSLQPVKNDPQAQGSVITYMRRYALAAVLGLNLDEDDDANRATHGAATPQEAAVKTATVAEKPWLDKNSKKWDLITERLRNKTTTLSQVAQYFKLNKEVRAELQSIINDGAVTPSAPVPNDGISEEDWDKWVQVVKGCTIKRELVQLYQSNASIIDSSDRLKTLFSDRQSQIEATQKKSLEHKVA